VSHLKRLLGFGIVPALSILSSVALIPLISRSFGPDGWVALTMGSSIGAIVSVIAGMAWSVFGGNAVASVGPQARIAMFRTSIAGRGVMLLALVPPAAVASLFLVDDRRLETILFMIGISLNALTASWFFAGTGEPKRLILNEGVVRLAVYMASAIALLAGAPLAAYAAATVVGGFSSLLLNWWFITSSPLRLHRADLSHGVTSIREQGWPTVSRVMISLFAFGSPSIFSIVAPSALSLYSAVDVLLKSASNATAVVPQAFISWIGSAARPSRRRRIVASMAAVTGMAAAFIIIWIFVGPTICDKIFSSQISWTDSLVLVLGAAIAITMVVRSYELLVLVPTGKPHVVYVANAAGSVAGVVLVAIGAARYGAIGGLYAWIVMHALLLLAYVVLSIRSRRERTFLAVESQL
jgi:PST family polysaccharide transporter